MTNLPPDLEALMPEPAVRDGDYAGPPGEGASEDYFTADQVRAVMLAVTERAAKVAEGLQDQAEEKRAMEKFTAAQGRRVAEAVARGNHWSTVNLFNSALKRAAAAIRGDEGEA